MLRIFDLDGTVIDSSHRQLSRADGTLDLDHWVENCTPEKIFADRLLPLARIMRQQIAQGARVVVCTARVMRTADFQFLNRHGLMPEKILHRSPNDTRKDGEYKIGQLSYYCSNNELCNAVMFDDAAAVRKALRPLGVKVIDPEPLNKKLA